jgi:hypothetical protein
MKDAQEPLTCAGTSRLSKSFRLANTRGWG